MLWDDRRVDGGVYLDYDSDGMYSLCLTKALPRCDDLFIVCLRKAREEFRSSTSTVSLRRESNIISTHHDLL